MVSYDSVLRAASEEGLSFTDIDRVLLNEDTYEEWRENMSSSPLRVDELSDHETVEGPAVRTTEGDEKMVYVDDSGREKEIVL